MKICVISNSHAASLKDGWMTIRNDFPQLEVTFFAAPNRAMSELKADISARTLYAENTQLKHTLKFTSGGLDTIEIDKYDAFLVYGLFLSVPRLDRRLSSSVKSATVLDSVNESINHRIAVDLCNMTDATVFYSPSPLLSDSILESESERVDPIEHYDLVCDSIHNHYDYPNAKLIKQSAETMGDELTTKKIYSKGSERLLQPLKHINEDVMHMNSNYGKKFMQMFLLQEMAKHPARALA